MHGWVLARGKETPPPESLGGECMCATPAAPATWAAVAYGPSTKWGRFKATLKMKNWHKKHDLWFAHDDEVRPPVPPGWGGGALR